METEKEEYKREEKIVIVGEHREHKERRARGNEKVCQRFWIKIKGGTGEEGCPPCDVDQMLAVVRAAGWGDSGRHQQQQQQQWEKPQPHRTTTNKNKRGDKRQKNKRKNRH